jgi:hypothetical protein
MTLQPDVPVAGWYQMRLVRGGPLVPVRIWHGLPIVDGEEQDRSPRWCVEVDGETTRRGELLDITQVWPWCAREPISEADYRFMVAHSRWAKTQPHHPKATPRRPIDKRGASIF